MGLLIKAIYGFVQAGRCCNNKFRDDGTTIEFKEPRADPYVFRKIADVEVEMVAVVHVNDIRAHAKDQSTMEKFPA